MDIQSSPYPYPGPKRLLSPIDAVTHVSNQAGCTIPQRDDIDVKLINELTSWGKTGQLISNERDSPMNYWEGGLIGGNKPTDSDGDGIPDEWERANGLNPNDASDAMKILANGYTNLEVYVNSLVPSTY